MKIEKFCSLLRRFSIKYEHHVTCIERRDLDEEVDLEKRLKELTDYFEKNYSEDEE
jgi:hypothetical protein